MARPGQDERQKYAAKNKLTPKITDKQLATCLKGFAPLALRYPKEVIRRDMDRASSAPDGAVMLDELQ